MRIAVIGARGFVGAAVYAALSRSVDYEVVPVVREGYETARRLGLYDIIINAAMPSKRYWARQNPRLDFTETVEKTFRLLDEWKWNKFVQISSISARSQLDTVYGRHKAAAEQLCAFGDNLIIRLGPTYGDGLVKGVLVDLASDRNVFAAPDSRYCFAPVSWVARTIAASLGRARTIEVGAADAVTLREVAEAIQSQSRFDGTSDHQEAADKWPSAPSAREVFTYALSLKRSFDACVTGQSCGESP
jgi:nucleoside-diphosphate-sugar epimerase